MTSRPISSWMQILTAVSLALQARDGALPSRKPITVVSIERQTYRVSSAASREVRRALLSPRFVRSVSSSDTFLNGDPLQLSIDGVAAGDTISIRAYRRYLQSRQVNGNNVTDTVLYASWAQFRADKRGHISIDSGTPVAGTWKIADPLALFWSMQRISPSADSGASRIPERSLPRGTTELLLVSRGFVIDSLLLRATTPKLIERTIVTDSTVGAFATPDDRVKHPALILLHGSEGGGTTSAKTLARRFAARGFAAYAVLYVAYPYAGSFAAVPNAFVNIPVETLDRARNWMGAQMQADTSRTGLWGVSKGAEFALVAASRRTWPRAVVACVASDVVWSGFGRVAAPGEVFSSWSDRGKSLPAIPYDNYDDVFANKATARVVHDRSRLNHPVEAASARIDVAAIKAPTLLYGSGRDEVWASASMVRNIEQSMEKAENSKLLVARTFENSGHGICGDGTIPGALYAPQPAHNVAPPDAMASASASSLTWRETIQFLKAQLQRERRVSTGLSRRSH